MSTPGKKLVVDTVRGREESQTKGKIRGEMSSQTLNQCDTIIYTQYTIQNSTVSTSEGIVLKEGRENAEADDNFQG